MVGEAECRARLAEAAACADLILIEGIMELHDGNPSSADLAVSFGVLVLVVIDAVAMAQTLSTLVLGLATYRSGLPFAGVLINRADSVAQGTLLGRSVLAPWRFSVFFR